MNDKMLKMLKAKKDKNKDSMSDNEKEAKLNVMKELRDSASKMMGDKVRGIKELSVVAPDKKGLEKGLDKAKELIAGEESEESQEHEAMEGESEDSAESEAGSEDDKLEQMSPEELDEMMKKIQELNTKKASEKESSY